MTGSSEDSNGEHANLEQAALLLAEGVANAEAAAEATELTSVVVSDRDTEVVAQEHVVEEQDEIRPGRANYGATDPNPSIVAEESGKETKAGKGEKEGKGGKKLKKSGVKEVSDALKTDMAAERTFFKWLWTGLHTGAIGSFIFIAFDGDKNDPMRLVVVGVSWLVALVLVLYGTFAYYRRRYALRIGNINVIPRFTREHSPLVVLTALVIVIGSALGYAYTSDFRPNTAAAGTAANAFGGA